VSDGGNNYKGDARRHKERSKGKEKKRKIEGKDVEKVSTDRDGLYGDLPSPHVRVRS